MSQIISVVKQCPNPSPATAAPYRFYLTENGDGTGAINHNGDYSAAPITIYFEAQYLFEIYNVLINISCASKTYQDKYGDITDGLTNGIKFYISTPGSPVDIPLLYNAGVKQNYEWLEITHDVEITQWEGNPQTISISLCMVDCFGIPLSISPGEIIKVVLNDDFSTLVNHSFRISGKYHINA
jgi:hypothetical protein